MTRTQIIPALISDLDISIRCLNTLKANNITLVSQLNAMSLKEIKSLRSINSKSVEEIQSIFTDLGLTFDNFICDVCGGIDIHTEICPLKNKS